MMRLSPRESAFVDGQASEFVDMMLRRLGAQTLAELTPVTGSAACELPVTTIADVAELSTTEGDSLAAAFASRHGVAAFRLQSPPQQGSTPHPLLALGEQVRDRLPVRHPLTHPAESAPFVLETFGRTDGTTKIFDVGTVDHDALTGNELSPHFDGTGNAGTVVTFGLYADSVPSVAPINYFQNLAMLAMDLAASDAEAFRSLFLPDAFTVIWQNLKLTRPVLYLADDGSPQTWFRAPERQVELRIRTGCPPLARARQFLDEHIRPFAPGSSYIALDPVGTGCLVDNVLTIHGRTAYTDSPHAAGRRVLSRKWWVRSAEDTEYRVCPGVRIDQRFAGLYPDLFGPQLLTGRWNYDPERDRNVSVAG